MKGGIALHPNDNVAVVASDVSESQIVLIAIEGQQTELQANEPIPFGHKIALQQIPKGHPVVKYGEVIGVASSLIRAGDHVHVNNVKSLMNC